MSRESKPNFLMPSSFFTVSQSPFATNPNGRNFSAVTAVQRDCEWPLKNGENSHRSRESTIHSDGGNSNLYLDQSVINKANLRDLVAATGLAILLKWDSNRRFFGPYDLEILWMTSKNNRAPLLYYVKLCASFQCHR